MDGIFGPAPDPEEITTSPEPEAPGGEQEPEGTPTGSQGADNESGREEPAPRLLAGKYKSTAELAKGIINLAKMKGVTPEIGLGASDDEMEAYYLKLNKQAKQGQVQTQPQPSENPDEDEEELDEEDETPLEYEADAQDFMAKLNWLRGLPEGTSPQAEPTPQANQAPSAPQGQSGPVQIDEPEVDFSPIVAKYSERFAKEYDFPNMDALTGFVGEMVKAIVDREARILGKGLQPFMQSVDGYLRTDVADKLFQQEAQRYFKVHPEQKELKGPMRDLWHKFPNLQGMKGGKDPISGAKMPTGIEFAAGLAIQYGRLQQGKTGQDKSGLRVKTGGGTPPKSAPVMKPEDKIRAQIFENPGNSPGVFG